ncbi:hypothetical protein OM427_15880 [Halomonas sp. 18H]|nr:hypothetical protein [Halomonas sp. 18H]MCW4151012.1 hypothetical protein [Halomonas sp. 18H]
MLNKSLEIALLKAGIEKPSAPKKYGKEATKKHPAHANKNHDDGSESNEPLPKNQNHNKTSKASNISQTRTTHTKPTDNIGTLNNRKPKDQNKQDPNKKQNTSTSKPKKHEEKFRPITPKHRKKDDTLTSSSLDVYGSDKASKKVKQEPNKKKEAQKPPKLVKKGNIELKINPTSNQGEFQLLEFSNSGMEYQPLDGEAEIDHDLTIGLDFGTSFVKASIGDRALGKSFAVPFRNGSGIHAYLAPTLLYQSASGEYTLTPQTYCIQNIKNSILNSQNLEDDPIQEQATAFLALILKRIRAWLFETHSSLYIKNHLIWRLAIGIPSAHKDEKHDFYNIVATAAWALSTSESRITPEKIENALSRASEILNGDEPCDHEDIEVEPVPEIAAQIYGHVVSQSFDKSKDNIFLMADIGSGTVDASIFRVNPKKGKSNFSFFTTTVENNGVHNLHQERLAWWKNCLANQLPEENNVIEEIHDNLNKDTPTSQIPSSFKDYISNIGINQSHDSYSPDDIFYRGRLLPQVRFRAYITAKQTRRIPPHQMQGIPFFLCGGGSRIELYKRLYQGMEHMTGYTWLNATKRSLTRPDNLEAKGVNKKQYDRLSVAYGLSLIEKGTIDYVMPEQNADMSKVNNTWRENYIEN